MTNQTSRPRCVTREPEDLYVRDVWYDNVCTNCDWGKRCRSDCDAKRVVIIERDARTQLFDANVRTDEVLLQW